MASIPNPSLDAGQQALNQGDYLVAIAHFEGVCELELDESLVTRAAMGLVTTYQGMGDAQRAIAIYKHLT